MILNLTNLNIFSYCLKIVILFTIFKEFQAKKIGGSNPMEFKLYMESIPR